jgi:hypothetical protein
MMRSASASKQPTPVEVLSSYLPFSTTDHRLWWYNTASVIGGFLDAAHYNVASQFEYLLFYHKYTVPSLGRYPAPENEDDRWENFLYRREPLELRF